MYQPRRWPPAAHKQTAGGQPADPLGGSFAGSAICASARWVSTNRRRPLSSRTSRAYVGPMRNPRRCYDSQGREVAPETVAGLLTAGIGRAEIWCNGCHHHAAVAIDRFPADTPVPDLCLRFRCSVCGGRNLSSRPSVLDHYAVLRERTGMGYGSTPQRDGRPPAGRIAPFR